MAAVAAVLLHPVGGHPPHRLLPGGTGGGVVLQRGRMEINCGFAELLRRARQEDSSAVAAVLFD